MMVNFLRVYIALTHTQKVPTGNTSKNVKQVQRPEMKPSEAIACVIANVALSNAVAVAPKKTRLSGGSPLMKMAEAGRVNEVRMMLEMDRSQVSHPPNLLGVCNNKYRLMKRMLMEGIDHSGRGVFVF